MALACFYLYDQNVNHKLIFLITKFPEYQQKCYIKLQSLLRWKFTPNQ